jgi:uncharacterized RDD family membrane protein YckC
MADPGPRPLLRAAWETRFWAWLIDWFVVVLALSALWSLVGVVTNWSTVTYTATRLEEFGTANGTALWAYWTLLEGHRGQSIGKRAVNIEVTRRDGAPVGFGTAAIESFGKAFVLPVDVVAGVLTSEGHALRLFNRLAKTIVVEADPDVLDGLEGVERVGPGDR